VSDGDPIHAPRQARSRQTLAKLLDAAEAVLAEEGLEGATVPAIAGRAGLSVGVVYRRFPDKDALMRAVFARFFERRREENAAKLAPELWAGVPPERAVELLIRGIVAGYRQNRRLLGALLRYAEGHPDAGFRRRADEMNASTLEQVARLVLERRERVGHPAPGPAVRFALLTVGLVLKGVLLADPPPPRIFLDESLSLEDELTRMVLGYLGLESEEGG
jgi:AcrR family transcriptional regulator